jgi:translation initiation factor eIF-2B subunit beta
MEVTRERERSKSGVSCLGAAFDLRTYLKSYPNVLRCLDALGVKLKRRQISGPHDSAMATVDVIRAVVGQCRWATAGQIMQILRAVGRELIAAKPTELAVGNMIRRALFIVREEYAGKLGEREGESDATGDTLVAAVGAPSLESLLGGATGDDGAGDDMSVHIADLKQSVAEGLNELKAELEDMNSIICEHAPQTIHANEVILTFGMSKTVMCFLLAAAEHYRKSGLTFAVIVAEGAPSRRGHQLASALTDAGIETTVIRDSAAFAMMARVNKVIMPTHAVMANGGLIALTGSHMIARAARELSVPVVCVTGLYKLCPIFPHDQDSFNCLLAPSLVMDYDTSDRMRNVQVLNPAYDYIPPELVDLYITNIGGIQPSYIYRLLAEYYHVEDALQDSY